MLYNSKKRSQIPTKIGLRDLHDQRVNISIFFDPNNTGTKKYYFYAEGCIINESRLDLAYHRVKSKAKLNLMNSGSKEKTSLLGG